MKNRKEAFDDAISATKAAMAEGIVPGGGLALLRAIDAVERGSGRCERRRADRALILKRALEAPTRQIAENSGVDGGVVVDRMRGGTGDYGFDASRGQYRRSRRGRHHRSHEGRAHRARERGLGGQRAAADRGDAHRGAGAKERVAAAGRDGLAASPRGIGAAVLIEPKRTGGHYDCQGDHDEGRRRVRAGRRPGGGREADVRARLRLPARRRHARSGGRRGHRSRHLQGRREHGPGARAHRGERSDVAIRSSPASPTRT